MYDEYVRVTIFGVGEVLEKRLVVRAVGVYAAESANGSCASASADAGHERAAGGEGAWRVLMGMGTLRMEGRRWRVVTGVGGACGADEQDDDAAAVRAARMDRGAPRARLV